MKHYTHTVVAMAAIGLAEQGCCIPRSLLATPAHSQDEGAASGWAGVVRCGPMIFYLARGEDGAAGRLLAIGCAKASSNGIRSSGFRLPERLGPSSSLRGAERLGEGNRMVATRSASIASTTSTSASARHACRARKCDGSRLLCSSAAPAARRQIDRSFVLC